MHYLDIIILIIVILSAVEGAVQGFIYEICSLLGLVAGFFLGIEYATTLAGYLDFIPVTNWILTIIAFFIILITANLILRMVGKSLRLILRKVFMGFLDRALGAIFGFVRGIAFVVFVVVILLMTPLGNVLIQQAPKTHLMAPAIELARPFLGIFSDNHTTSPDAI